jgi:hypothetical protein
LKKLIASSPKKDKKPGNESGIGEESSDAYELLMALMPNPEEDDPSKKINNHEIKQAGRERLSGGPNP